jgi:hypothetical protein
MVKRPVLSAETDGRSPSGRYLGLRKMKLPRSDDSCQRLEMVAFEVVKCEGPGAWFVTSFASLMVAGF